MSSFPPELLVAIAEQLDAGPWDRKDLRRLCLVSRGWYKAAQLELYRVVTYQSRGAQLARTMKARPDLAKAVRHFIVILPSSRDLDKHLRHLTTIFRCTASITELTIPSESVPAPVLAALAASPRLLDLKELDLYEPLRSPGELSQFTTFLATCPPLRRLHFEGTYFDEHMPPAELHRVREAAKRHSLTSLGIGIACPNDALHIFASHSYATLQRLSLEISVSPDPRHLSSLTGLRWLEIYVGYLEGKDPITASEASMRARKLLPSCKALPKLRSVILDLSRDIKYYVGEANGGGIADDYILDTLSLHELPPTLSTLEINTSLVNADEFLTFLDSTHRPPSLAFIKTDLYSKMSHPSKLKTVLRRLHSLGIRYEIAPFEVFFYDVEDHIDRRQSWWSDEIKSAGPVLKWDGGEWSEPDIESEVESESESYDETELEDDFSDGTDGDEESEGEESEEEE
ncbi:hypothetical protein BCR35DRAFT_328879 [Leucosporidium creatinivorum]|uniref:Uncharacterized protein n=1 Tax=Leucosporidium creatinivorum TaxID=106004 RepID=A0A1Y2G4S9_9BASI|nr:hypothetical protein BCR35DRAFT_328879 [Leucosporidium creatinivorum]